MQLNLEQKRIIESKQNGHMLIKGVVGSGKTSEYKILVTSTLCVSEEV